MWLFFAILAPIFFAIVHVLDSYCVEDVFEEPWIGTVTSSIATLMVVIVPLPFVLPLFAISLPSAKIIILCIFSGVLIQISQFLYFKSLSHSEAGIVAAYWNLIPVFIPLISFIFLHEILEPKQYLGIIVLVTVSTYMLVLDTNRQMRQKSLVLMFIASLIQACAYLIFDYTYAHITFFESFVLMSLGIIITGLVPICITKTRNKLKKNYFVLIDSKKLFILIEALNVIALLFAQRAIFLGDPSLVAAAETTIPAFVFLFTFLLVRREKYKMIKFGGHLPSKVICVLIMCLGVALIS